VDFFETIERRYSVRGYKPDPVPDELLERVLESARLAPTACNLQPFRIVVLHTRGREDELARIYGRGWFTQAPLVLAVVALTGEAWRNQAGKSYADVDATIVMDHLILAATALGLGTCWVAAFDAQAAREILALPEGAEPVAFTPLGYAEKAPAGSGRRLLSELVTYERW